MCAAEPPCPSDNSVGAEGAAALARALDKNTTLQTFNLQSEFVAMILCGEGCLIGCDVICDIVFDCVLG